MKKLKRNPTRRWTTTPTIRFSPWAWAKLIYLRDLGPTEIGGFGISADRDLLLLEDVVLVNQQCSAISVAFDDSSVADFFDNQVDRGLSPAQFARIWVHTHPGNSAGPSAMDEDTFDHVFGQCDWAVMFILARGGQTYARLRFNVGPGGDLEIDTEVDFGYAFPGSDHEAWQQEYSSNVRPIEIALPKPKTQPRVPLAELELSDWPADYPDELGWEHSSYVYDRIF